MSKPSFYAISVTYSIRFFAFVQNDIRKLTSFQCCKSLINLLVHAGVLSKFLLLLVKLSLRSFVYEVRISEHTVYTLKLTFKPCLFLLKSLNFLSYIYEFCKRNVDYSTIDNCGYRIITDTGLIRLDGNRRCSAECLEEYTAVREDILNLLRLRYYIFSCFT